MLQAEKSIWLDGELVDWEKATVHVLTHTLHYGLGVFEGIRSYRRSDGGGGIVHLDAHIQRFFDSAHIATLEIPYTQAQLRQACVDVLKHNQLTECYLRPLAFVGDGAMGLGALDNPTRVAVIAWRWGRYLGQDALEQGIRTKIASLQRPGINALMAKGKIVGHYVNSILAKREALQAGYDEALLLDAQGYVAEATGENVFVVHGNTVSTPPLGLSLLGGITRASVIALLQDQGMTVQERLLSRDELYIADELFLCGTAAEITPLRELDHRKIGRGTRGPVTEKVQQAYFRAVRGEDPRYADWLTAVE